MRITYLYNCLYELLFLRKFKCNLGFIYLFKWNISWMKIYEIKFILIPQLCTSSWSRWTGPSNFEMNLHRTSISLAIPKQSNKYSYISVSMYDIPMERLYLLQNISWSSRNKEKVDNLVGRKARKNTCKNYWRVMQNCYPSLLLF